MGLTPGQKISDVEINTVFIGSCTNSRIEDIRSAAEIIKGKKVSTSVKALVVPGSGLVKKQAEDGIRDQPRSRGLGDVYKRQIFNRSFNFVLLNFVRNFIWIWYGAINTYLSLIHI